MDLELEVGKNGGDDSFEGHFLIAMPGMSDEGAFSRAVVYICAHSPNGAMGFIINKPQPLSFRSLMTQLGIVSSEDDIRLSRRATEVPVCMGGPVETGRGFVLHSDDYDSESTVRVDERISLTPTVDILKAISVGLGPRTAIMTLGYAGWAPGQLENEIAANGWLTCPADLDIVFGARFEEKYERALALLGIQPAFLASEAGHA